METLEQSFPPILMPNLNYSPGMCACQRDLSINKMDFPHRWQLTICHGLSCPKIAKIKMDTFCVSIFILAVCHLLDLDSALAGLAFGNHPFRCDAGLSQMSIADDQFHEFVVIG